jgi:DNA-binding NarL/FixJ family response regulator
LRRAADGKEAVAKAGALRPDIVITDISMPGMHGLSAAREIRRFCPETAIIILSMHESKQLIESSRKIGTRGYITKSQAGSTFLAAIDPINQQRSVLPPASRSCVPARVPPSRRLLSKTIRLRLSPTQGILP